MFEKIKIGQSAAKFLRALHVTMKQNIHHARDTGLTPQGEKHSKAKYSDETLLTALSKIKEGKSVASIAREFNISQSYLNKVKNRVYRSDLMDKA